jgi:predicted DNA-binding protein
MYALYIMRRTQIYLDEAHDRALTERAQAAGRTKSELIREAIDRYLSPNDGAAEATVRFRNAVAAAAGVAPHLPSGAEYVDAVREGDERRESELSDRRDG